MTSENILEEQFRLVEEHLRWLASEQWKLTIEQAQRLAYAIIQVAIVCSAEATQSGSWEALCRAAKILLEIGEMFLPANAATADSTEQA